MSKTLMIHHVVFCTKNRRPTINMDFKCDLYSMIYHILKKNKCWVYRINGMSDHVHLLFDLHPTVAMASLIKEIKTDTNKFMTENEKFPCFNSWGEGYFAVSVSPGDKEVVIEYIKGQQTHHIRQDVFFELEDMIERNGMKWHPDDWD